MQWHIPIGYKVMNGTITVHEEQRNLVNQIFQAYDNGESASRIAQRLKDEGIKNAQDRVAWTHTTIGRILEKRQYLGNEYYPQIIDKDLFERVQKRREQYMMERGRGKYRPGESERIMFEGRLICGECGETYCYIQAKRRVSNGKPAKWKCRNYEYRKEKACAGGTLTDEQVRDICINAINRIIQNRNLIKRKEQAIANPSVRYREWKQRLEKAKEKSRQEETDTDIMRLLYEKAEERYRTLEVKDTDYKTKEMEQMLEGKEELKDFDEELYRKLIKKIVVYKDNSVKVIFHNGSNLKLGYADRQQPGKE